MLSYKAAFPNSEPHWILDNLVVAKDAQKQGVATALLNWGYELADKKGLPIFLMSSPEVSDLLSIPATIHAHPLFNRAIRSTSNEDSS